MKRFILLGLVLVVSALLLFSCSRGDRKSGGGKGVAVKTPLPTELRKLSAPQIASLKAEVEISDVGIYQLTVNPDDDSVSGTITDIPIGEHTFTIRYYILYGAAQTKLVLAEQTITETVEGGKNIALNFPSENNTYPGDDSDGCSNLIEYEKGWNPLQVDSTCSDETVDKMTFGEVPVSQFGAVFSLSSTEAWAVTRNQILYYSNGVWKESIKVQNVKSIFFINPNEGWAVGTWVPVGGMSSGTIYHFIGGSWGIVHPPTVSSNWELSSVHFTSSDEGWAVGYDGINKTGVLLHYQYGTWTNVTPPSVSSRWELRSVNFPTADEGWAVGSDLSTNNFTGVLLHYQSGTWTNVTPPSVSNCWQLSSVYFTGTDGWAVGVDEDNGGSNSPIGVLLHYQNWKWTNVTPLAISYWWFNSVHFTSANEGWAVGSRSGGNGVLLHYQSGTWTNVTPPQGGGELLSVHFSSPTEGWIGGDNLLHYQSGTWTTVTPPTVSDFWKLYSAQFTSADEGWAVGHDEITYTALLLHYQSGTWSNATPSSLIPNQQLMSVYFTSATDGWVVGGDSNNNRPYLLFHYQSGTWTNVPYVPSTESGYLTSVYFTSADEGWAVGYDYTNGTVALLHYQSGSWNSVTPPSVTGSLYSVHFTSADEGWAVGDDNSGMNDNGIILHYHSGNWDNVPSPVNGGLYSIYFTSPDDGWAVGYDMSMMTPVILHYQSGTWNAISPPYPWYFMSVYFTSADDGWAVGYDWEKAAGLLLHYQGGGWSVFSKVDSNRLSWELEGVSCYDADNCWFVGEGDWKGLIMKY